MALIEIILITAMVFMTIVFCFEMFGINDILIKYHIKKKIIKWRDKKLTLNDCLYIYKKITSSRSWLFYLSATQEMIKSFNEEDYIYLFNILLLHSSEPKVEKVLNDTLLSHYIDCSFSSLLNDAKAANNIKMVDDIIKSYRTLYLEKHTH